MRRHPEYYKATQLLMFYRWVISFSDKYNKRQSFLVGFTMLHAEIRMSAVECLLFHFPAFMKMKPPGFIYGGYDICDVSTHDEELTLIPGYARDCDE